MDNIYESYDDNHLVLLIKKSDERAFRILFDRYWKKLLKLALAKLNSYQDTEEIVQTVFINFWRRRNTIELKFSFHTYISAVLKYEILKKLALDKKEKQFTEKLSVLYVIEDNATKNWMDFNQLRGEIEKAVHLLPPKCQIVFKLSRESGLSEKQIAKSLNIAPKTVQAHMGRALKQLRNSIQQLILF